ncbi:Cytochrome P450 [Corchorus olitorius]|uniref:Cytochrome P450 n=1 Tax=Corchorus olitorius TaxID=93759 RepID=A0A1R3HSH8_9ROSI|nr:Cytochrome P450 [Corchorus olitorius]
MEEHKAKIAVWNIAHIKRGKNEIADGLAKAGVERQNNLVLLKNKKKSCKEGLIPTREVIDETLRIRTNIFGLFREATKDIELNGYLIPKGWKVLVWHSAIHMDPEIYSNPKEFLPSRWDDLRPKAGTFQPFGAGSKTCPGADLAKLEISVFLHYFLLNYKLEQLNPGGPVDYLPSPDPVDRCRAKIVKLH